ncbi:endospore germination permease [Clostridium estertheticum]|uniref:endospore germination permease n=1 Tax=Clostridium estertheticum TaxID=238834 RepID=UPI001C0BBA61|nr:endospore germination permease [Clostridium estertheticum]MBU3213683.1 endospore germination permease [Clostridium estertheticum]WAG53576.1 endospore germination permease [Clostridium estertheticum]
MDKLNTKHLMFIIWATSIVAMKTYPNIFIVNGGRDSWISVIIASIILFFYFIFLISVCKKTKCYNMDEIYHKALGKTTGNIFLILFIITLIVTLIESSSVEANALHVNMLADTPAWFFLLFIAIPAIYITKKGTRAIIIITIIAISLIMMAGINLAILTAKYKKLKYLLPVMANGITTSFILSVIKALGCYGSIAISIPFLTRVTNKSKIIKHCVIALLIVIQMEIFANIGLLSTFDVTRTLTLNYPKLIQTQLVSYFDFLEVGEFFVMLQMVGGWFIKYVLALNAILILLKNLSFFNKYMIYIITLFVFIISYFISAKVLLLYKFLNLYVYFSVISFILIPTIIFSIFYFKTKINSRKFNIK